MKILQMLIPKSLKKTLIGHGKSSSPHLNIKLSLLIFRLNNASSSLQKEDTKCNLKD